VWLRCAYTHSHCYRGGAADRRIVPAPPREAATHHCGPCAGGIEADETGSCAREVAVANAGWKVLVVLAAAPVVSALT
jgi:hypothetical protein